VGHFPFQYITGYFTAVVVVSIIPDYFSVFAKREEKENGSLRE
jgi:hypothetical protein